MRLHAVLVWYDEAPSWLSATVSSLRRIGVDHLVAVDGAYAHFPDARANSGVEQSEAVSLAADAAGISLTLHRPSVERVTEAEKRSLGFRLVESVATLFEDWVIVIDADEVVVEGFDVKAELATITPPMHVAAVRLIERIDPQTTTGKNNTSHTPNIYRNMEINPEFGQLQSRLFRVMRNMRSDTTHFNYLGDDAVGVTHNLRPDIGKSNFPDLADGGVHRFLDGPRVTLEHRDPWRTMYRRRQKAEYYQLRDDLGLERVVT